jgi:hypothetical protein
MPVPSDARPEALSPPWRGLMRKVSARDLFDGSLDEYGVREHVEPGMTNEKERYLTVVRGTDRRGTVPPPPESGRMRPSASSAPSVFQAKSIRPMPWLRKACGRSAAVRTVRGGTNGLIVRTK